MHPFLYTAMETKNLPTKLGHDTVVSLSSLLFPYKKYVVEVTHPPQILASQIREVHLATLFSGLSMDQVTLSFTDEFVV